MLKALFLDLDETLCDTRRANDRAAQLLGQAVEQLYGNNIDGQVLAQSYLTAIYRHWSDAQRTRYMPIIERAGEGAFRTQLIRDLLEQRGIRQVSDSQTQMLQEQFDRDRLAAFHFYPGILEFLTQARKLFTLVVITNGPEFSQLPKVEAVNLAEHVDYIIIGGQEPEEKPARSIFQKALKLANCEPHEAIHVGDSLATDITGALNCGITSVWIRHQQPLDAELGINPHHTVMHPSEIPALIRELHPTE